MKKLALLAVVAGVALVGCSDTVTRETTYHRTTTSSVQAPDVDPIDGDDGEVTTKRTRVERTYEID